MKSLLDEKSQKRLSDICLSNSFVKRGTAFFRVYGDGVFQVVKFNYERVFSHYELVFGLQSMYSELPELHFTSRGCIPRHYVFSPEGRSNAVTSREEFIFEIFIDPPSIQVDYFENHIMDLLNSVVTQEKLANTICWLNPIWIDSEKIAPFLIQNKLGCAEKVIYSILHQHLPSGTKGFCNKPWSYEDYVKYSKTFPGEDTDLLEIYSWIHNNDQDAIKDYLKRNYVKNCKFAKFCMGK